MSGIQIIVQRDSVCAGDDVSAPNESRFWLNEEAHLSEIFKELAASGYLSSIAGFNERWEVTVNGTTVCSFGKNIESPSYLVPSNTPVREVGNFKGIAIVWLKYFTAAS